MGNVLIVCRLAVLTIAAALLWLGALALDSVVATHAWRRTLQGVIVSLGALAIICALRGRASGPWRDVGIAGVCANLRAFLLGAGLWCVPALLGIAACVGMGWTSIELRATPTALFVTLLPLALGVFLLEALPEELLFRGYAQGLVDRHHAAWIALLAQMLLFVGFAYAIGALTSLSQWMLVPGLALILGYARALGGNVWTCIGIHFAWMTTTQLLASPQITVTGMQTLQFVAFALLPSATVGTLLSVRRPDFDWRQPAADRASRAS